MCTTGMAVPPPIWIWQPTLPVAMTSGDTDSMFCTLRARSCLAMSGCSKL